jgi:hypothetical protein
LVSGNPSRKYRQAPGTIDGACIEWIDASIITERQTDETCTFGYYASSLMHLLAHERKLKEEAEATKDETKNSIKEPQRPAISFKR